MTTATPVARPRAGGAAAPDPRGGHGAGGGGAHPDAADLASAVAAAAAAPPACVRQITTAAELDAVLSDASVPPADGGRLPLVVLEVYATHCRACKGIARAFTRVCEVHREAIFLASNADVDDDLMRRLGVRGTPTFVLFRGGVRIDHFYAKDREALEEQVVQNL